jgi:hypothetical protein
MWIHEGLVIIGHIREVRLVSGGGAAGKGNYVKIPIEDGHHPVVLPPTVGDNDGK